MIQTLKHRYHIIRVIENGDQHEIMLVREPSVLPGLLYTLIRLKQPQTQQHIILLFAQQQENQAFADYIECFAQSGQFFMVFKYDAHLPLRAQLRQRIYSCRERLTIAKSLFSHITMLNLPPSILLETLGERNLLLDDALQIHFNYYLNRYAEYPRIDLSMVQYALADILKELFPDELLHRVQPDLYDFWQLLETGRYSSYLEMYRAYDQINIQLQGRLPEQPDPLPGPWFRRWETLKRGGGWVIPVGIGVLVGAAFFYLLFSLLHPAVPVNGSAPLEQIGQVMIRE